MLMIVCVYEITTNPQGAGEIKYDLGPESGGQGSSPMVPFAVFRVLAMHGNPAHTYWRSGPWNSIGLASEQIW